MSCWAIGRRSTISKLEDKVSERTLEIQRLRIKQDKIFRDVWDALAALGEGNLDAGKEQLYDVLASLRPSTAL